MRVLLVTWTEQLLEKLSRLNPELEYCAIVVDEVEPAKEILAQFGLPENLLYPLYDLKECVRDFYYDYVLCVEERAFLKLIQEYGAPKHKILGLNFLNSGKFFTKRLLQYFKEHASEFDMFATGMSYIDKCLDVTRFKKKILNFARPSQDLYYDFQVAKHVVLYGGKHNRIRYALIGLAPFSFSFDLSKAINISFSMLEYFIAFGDLHNFHISPEVYKKFLREKYFSKNLSLENFDPFKRKKDYIAMGPKEQLKTRNAVDSWAEKNYHETQIDNAKILDEYLVLCEENGIRPIIFLPPKTEGYKKHFNKRILDEFHYIVGQALRKHPSAVFLDGWKLQGLTDADFRDCDHMNIMGAAKFSIFLNSVIEQLDAKK